LEILKRRFDTNKVNGDRRNGRALFPIWNPSCVANVAAAAGRPNELEQVG